MSVKQKDPQQSHERCQKNLQRKEQQYKKQKALLQQQIQFLSEQLKQYKQRQADNKKINQSIMITYQQNQNIRQEHISRSIKILTQKHQDQLSRMKDVHYRQCKMLEDSLAEYKDKYQQTLIEIDRKKVEYQRKFLQLQKKIQQQYKNKLDQKQSQYQFKVQMINEKLKKAQNMAELYQQFVQKRRNNIYGDQDGYVSSNVMYNASNVNPNNTSQMKFKQSMKVVERPSISRKQDISINICRQNQREQNRYNNNRQFDQNKQNRNRVSAIVSEKLTRQSRRSRIKDIQQNNIKDMKRLSVSRQSVKHLTAKIERAVTQLKGSNNYKLHQRINEKLSKRL